MRRYLLALLLFCSCFALAQTGPSKLKSGDLIGVVVAGYKDYDGDYRVLEDGSISGVGFGRLVVAGKTIDEVKGMIVAELKKRFKDPYVDVILREQRPSYVFVIGSGGSGQVPFVEGTDLRQLLGTITLPTPPDTLDVRFTRKGQEARTFDLDKFLRGEENWDGELQPGDVITLLPKTIHVTVAGEVNSPGDYTVRNDATLNMVLANAHGPNAAGSLKNVVVFRGSDVYQVDASAVIEGGKTPTFALKSNDLVYVRRNENIVFALGEVNSPGKYLVPDGKTFYAADLLAEARGLNDRGTLRRVVLIRPDVSGKLVAKQFNLDEYLKDGKKESNPELMSGDILLFGQPKGVTLGSLTQVASAALLFETLFKR